MISILKVVVFFFLFDLGKGGVGVFSLFYRGVNGDVKVRLFV